MTTSALIIVDMQNEFLNCDGAQYIGETVKKIIPEIQKKISQYREAGRPVIYLCQVQPQNGFCISQDHCTKGPASCDIHKDLRPAPSDIIIEKPSYSGFFGTNLDEVLKEHAVRTVEVAGVCTNTGVLYTCCDARQRQYNVTVDRRCIDTCDRSSHEFAVKEMARVLGVKMV